MAKARPPLPDSDDPFVVLGLPPTASEREVRRACVKLYKVYRPRKAPADFDRLRAAQERALWLVDVRDREGRAGMTAALGRMALGAGTLEIATDQPVASAEARAAWLAEVARTLTSKPDAAMAMITTPAVLGDASRDPDWAIAVLRAIGAASWRVPGVADVRGRIRLASGKAVDEMSERVAGDLDAARAFHAWHRPILLPGFLEVIADGRIVDDDQHRANLTLFGEQLRLQPDETLGYFDAIALRCPQLVDPLARRLLEEVPADRRDLHTTSAERQSAVGAAMRAVSRRTPFVGAVASLGAVSAVSAAGFIATGGTGGGGISAFGIWAWYAFDKRAYEKRVRGLLARALLDVGVTRACAREWLDSNRGRALRLARFSFHMRQDRALLLHGMAVAATAPYAR
ncbi:MAG TPA: J domain-containing protein [Kofleriaceae bacterium]|nr:J domain-containing protein [Kofleriaceae bacterium]